MRCRRPCNGHHCNNSSCTESIVSSTHTRMITQRMHDQTRQVRGDAAAVVQRAQRAQSVQAVSSLSADVSSLLIASCPHHITQSEIGSHTLTRLQPSPMSENRNANALPQAFPFVTGGMSAVPPCEAKLTQHIDHHVGRCGRRWITQREREACCRPSHRAKITTVWWTEWRIRIGVGAGASLLLVGRFPTTSTGRRQCGQLGAHHWPKVTESPRWWVTLI